MAYMYNMHITYVDDILERNDPNLMFLSPPKYSSIVDKERCAYINSLSYTRWYVCSKEHATILVLKHTIEYVYSNEEFREWCRLDKENYWLRRHKDRTIGFEYIGFEHIEHNRD